MAAVSRKESEIILHVFLCFILYFLKIRSQVSWFPPYSLPLDSMELLLIKSTEILPASLRTRTRQAWGAKDTLLVTKEGLGNLLGMNLLTCDRGSSAHFLNRWSIHSLYQINHLSLTPDPWHHHLHREPGFFPHKNHCSSPSLQFLHFPGEL